MPDVCPVGARLYRASSGQNEVARMILEDVEGYSDEFAATCLAGIGVYNTSPEISGEDVSKHRRGKCLC